LNPQILRDHQQRLSEIWQDKLKQRFGEADLLRHISSNYRSTVILNNNMDL